MSRTRKNRAPRSVIAGSSIALAGLVGLTACTPSLPGDDGAASGGDSSLTILLSDTLDSLDPATAMATAGRQTTWLLYEPLVRLDPETEKASPGIAEEWELSPTSLQFTIKEGITCADGSEITAQTVANNFERWKDPATNAPLVNNFFGSADFTVTVDEVARTVDVELTTAMPFLGTDESAFTQLGIACQSALDDPSVFAKGSDGTSPYTVKEYVVGSHVTLERRDDYTWGPDGFDVAELPKTVNLKVVGDPNTQVNLLIGGDADAATLQPDQLPRIERETGFTKQVESTSVAMMMFNEREGFPTADVNVRRALAQAVDFQELANVQSDGLAYVANFLRPPGEVCVDESAIKAVMPTGGIEGAAKTLEGAGYTKGADGMFAKDGKPLTVTLLGMELTSPSVELLTKAWNEAGITVEYDDRASAQAVDVLYSGTGWDVSFVGMGASQPTGFRPFFVGPPAPDGPNFGAISNPDYARLQAEASALGADGCPLWIEAEAAIVANVDWVPSLAMDSKWVLREGVSFFTDGAKIDPLTLRKK